MYEGKQSASQQHVASSCRVDLAGCLIQVGSTRLIQQLLTHQRAIKLVTVLTGICSCSAVLTFMSVDQGFALWVFLAPSNGAICVQGPAVRTWCSGHENRHLPSISMDTATTQPQVMTRSCGGWAVCDTTLVLRRHLSCCVGLGLSWCGPKCYFALITMLTHSLLAVRQGIAHSCGTAHTLWKHQLPSARQSRPPSYEQEAWLRRDV